MPLTNPSASPADLALHMDDQAHHQQYPSIYGGITARRGAIALRFDDFTTNDFLPGTPTQSIAHLLNARGLQATFGVIAGAAAGLYGGQYLGWDSIHQAAAFGNEIACHSQNHSLDTPATTEGTYTQFVTETVMAQANIKAQKLQAESFIQPGTWLNTWNFDASSKLDTAIGRVLRANFAAANLYVTDPVQNTVNPLPRYRRIGGAHFTPSGANSAAALAAAQDTVDRLIATGGAAALLFHAFEVGDGTHMSWADLTTFLTYVQTKRDAGLIDVLTVTGLEWATRAEAKVNLLADPNWWTWNQSGTMVHWSKNSANAPVLYAPGSVPNGGAYVDPLTGVSLPAVKVNGNAAAGNNDIRQFINAVNCRVVRAEAYVKSAVGATPTTGRMYIQQSWPSGGAPYNAAPYTYYAAVSTTITTSDAWQKVAVNATVHPDCTQLYLRLTTNSNVTPDVVWTAPVLFKV